MIDDTLKHKILGADDLPLTAVSTPEWPETDGKLYLRPLTAAQRVAFGISLDEGKQAQNYWARLVVLCLCDGEGHRVFADADAEALGAKSSLIMQRLARLARRMSGMGEEAEDDAKKN